MNNALLEKLVMKLLDAESKESEPDTSPWQIGENYLIRTVTMHLTGKLIALTDKELVLFNASWIADSGRFHDALETGTLSEVEPFIDNVIVSRAALVDATKWRHDLPRAQK
jgi:hypothetical protein